MMKNHTANDSSPKKMVSYNPPPITGNPNSKKMTCKTNEVNIEKPKSVHESVVSKPKINRDKVIIEDWNSDDEDDVSEVNTVSPVKTNETQTVKTQVDKIGQISQKEGIGFKKIKACFVYKSTDHLIKDCDFYAKKSPEPKLKTMVNTGVLTRTGLVNPVRPNGKRAVHTVSTARPISTARPVSTARPFAPKIAQTGSAIRPIYLRMDNVRPRASYSPIKRSYYTKPAFRPKNLKQDVKTSGVKNMTKLWTRAVVNTGKGKMDNDLKKSRWVWRPKGNYMDHESKEKGSFILKKFEYVDPKGISNLCVVDSVALANEWQQSLSFYNEDYNTALWLLEVDPKGVNVDASTQEHYVAGSSEKDKEPTQEYILLPLHPHRLRISVEDIVQAAQEKPFETSPHDTVVQDSEDVAKKEEQHILTESDQAFKDDHERDPKSAVQTRGKIQKASSVQQALVSYIYNQNRTNHKDHQNCLFACFLSQEEPKNISQALQDESWVEAMQEELLQFKLQKVWVLVDLPYGKKVIGTKWVFRNKRDERSIVVKNKARLVAQGFRQEEGIDYDEVFAPVARIEAIRLFLAFASYMGFTVYQMDIKSAFLYGTIKEEVYVHQPLCFVDHAHPNKVYKVIKALYGLHQASRAWYETLSSFLLENGFRRGTIDC
ncbi:putative ribonuclease H-like domain-containing protein [Tanacetum coccineum]